MTKFVVGRWDGASGLIQKTDTPGTGADSLDYAVGAFTNTTGLPGPINSFSDWNNFGYALFNKATEAYDGGVSLANFHTHRFYGAGGGGNDLFSVINTDSAAIRGHGGNDTLTSGDPSDTLYGDEGDDLLNAGAGSNMVDGGAGDDTVIAGLGDDTVTAGALADQDWILVQSGALPFSFVTVDLETFGLSTDYADAVYEHFDNVRGSAIGDSIAGSSEANILDGAGGADTLDGRGGNDLLMGGAATDSLVGGDDDDSLEGGAGNDTLDGGAGVDTVIFTAAGGAVRVELKAGPQTISATLGTDTLIGIENIFGGSSGDTLIGSSGANTINGGYGGDSIDGGGGADVLIGDDTDYITNNDDSINGGAGADLLQGSDGDDVLDGGSDVDDDSLQGGAGDDTLIGGGGGDKYIGGGDIDVLSFAGLATSVLIQMGGNSGSAEVGGRQQVIFDVEHIIGSSADDTIRGSTFTETLDGGAGDDLLSGSYLDDVFIGGDGMDVVSYAAASSGVSVSLLLLDPQDTHHGMDKLSGVEGLIGSAFADFLGGVTGLGSGLGGDDRLEGIGATLRGGDGDDRLVGLGEDAVFQYSPPRSAISFPTPRAAHLDGGDGQDTADLLRAGAGAQLDLASTEVQMTGGAGSLTVVDVEHVMGTAFNDTLFGTNGDNRLNGGKGKDVLAGRDGVDTLIGGGGKDLLMGQGGGDVLSGGLSKDRFAFASTGDIAKAAPDLILDLANDDRIDLSAIDANIGKAGDQHFELVTALSGKAGQAALRYDATLNETRLLLDVNGDSKADGMIVMSGDHRDFINFAL